MTEEALILVDGFNMAFRSYYGMPDLARSDGFPTGALHGWVKTLWWVEDNCKPAKVVVFFDLGGAERQSALREDYKANRGETPPDLELQIPVIKQLTALMGYGAIEKSGIEADDLIASAVKANLAQGGSDILILSADKDLAQLVQPGVKQLLPPPTANPKIGWRELDEAAVISRFGVKPSQIPDYLAIIGDTSDNIPGIKGVGPKTASKWLQQYGSLQGVIDHSGELNPKRFQGVIYNQIDELRKNLQMTTLEDSFELPAIPPSQLDEAEKLISEMEMGNTLEQFRKRIA